MRFQVQTCFDSSTQSKFNASHDQLCPSAAASLSVKHGRVPESCLRSQQQGSKNTHWVYLRWVPSSAAAPGQACCIRRRQPAGSHTRGSSFSTDITQFALRSSIGSTGGTWNRSQVLNLCCIPASQAALSFQGQTPRTPRCLASHLAAICRVTPLASMYIPLACINMLH